MALARLHDTSKGCIHISDDACVVISSLGLCALRSLLSTRATHLEARRQTSTQA